MKWQIVLLICLSFLGCGSIPSGPDFDIGGLITIKTIDSDGVEYDYIKGIFKVIGGKNRFLIFIQDSYNQPQGRIIVEDGKIIGENIPYRKLWEALSWAVRRYTRGYVMWHNKSPSLPFSVSWRRPPRI